MALSILLLNPHVGALTWLAGRDSRHPAAIRLALGCTAAPQHIAWVTLEGDVGPRVVGSTLSFSHFSILDAGACASDHWKCKAAEHGLGKGLPALGVPSLLMQGQTSRKAVQP